MTDTPTRADLKENATLMVKCLRKIALDYLIPRIDGAANLIEKQTSAIQTAELERDAACAECKAAKERMWECGKAADAERARADAAETRAKRAEIHLENIVKQYPYAAGDTFLEGSGYGSIGAAREYLKH